MIQWLICRVAVIYFVLFVFSLTCVDLKTLDMRSKARRLNEAVPNFTDMINSSVGKNAMKDINWSPYRNYFELILRYVPNDAITEQLLGYVDYYSNQKERCVQLLKSASMMKGQNLFWPNYNAGVVYYKMGLWPQAAEYLFKAISSNPKLMRILMQDSIVYKQIFATPAFSYNLDEGMINAKSKAYILLLSSLYSMRQYDKVMILADLALADKELLDRDAFYFYDALAYFQLGQMDRAFMLLQKSLTIEKDNPDVYYYMANIFQKAGQVEQAREFLQVSYALHQKNDPRFPYETQVNLHFF